MFEAQGGVKDHLAGNNTLMVLFGALLSKTIVDDGTYRLLQFKS